MRMLDGTSRNHTPGRHPRRSAAQTGGPLVCRTFAIKKLHLKQAELRVDPRSAAVMTVGGKTSFSISILNCQPGAGSFQMQFLLPIHRNLKEPDKGGLVSGFRNG